MLAINISFLYILISTASALDTCPVFVLDEGLLDGTVKSQSNPMVKTDKEEFELLIDTAYKFGKCLLFFVEDTLSFEDISSKDEKGTPFNHLKESFFNKRVKLFPRVVDPYNYLKNRFQPFDFNTFHVHPTTTSLHLGEESYKFMYIFFEDSANETRIQKLRRHDAVIQKVYFAVKQIFNGPVVAFYTGKRNPIVDIDRRHMQAETTTTMKPVDINTQVAHCGNATFQFDAVMEDPLTGSTSGLIVGKCDYVTENNDTWTYRITLNDVHTSYESSLYELKLTFTDREPKNHRAGWKLKKVEYLSPSKGPLKTEAVSVADDWNHSYESHTPLILVPEAKFQKQPTLMIKSHKINLMNNEAKYPKTFQTQWTTEYSIETTQKVYKSEIFVSRPEVTLPDTSATKNLYKIAARPKFRAANDANAGAVYVTIAIVTCELLVFMLLGLLFFGIWMIMSVHTNDIFDSPDQKPLFTSDAIGGD